MGELTNLIDAFVESVGSGAVEVYNEMSLQHELGVFLRGRLAGYKVQFERNVSFFFDAREAFTKKEIDISVFSPERSELKCAIELKYPRNGQHPEQMFSFCKDIAFAEELNAAGFARTGLVIFADDHLFYTGPNQGIYGYFRGGHPIHGRIQKPTGRKDAEVTLRGSYLVRWLPVSGSLMYSVVEVGGIGGVPNERAAEASGDLAKREARG
jgi:hypothetical protein